MRKLDVAGSEMVSRSIAKTCESSARRLKSRIWPCAARAEPCRKHWSIREASTPGFHAVFAEPGDITLLGAHSLEGLNLKIDPVRKELVPAGPVITAAA